MSASDSKPSKGGGQGTPRPIEAVRSLDEYRVTSQEVWRAGMLPDSEWLKLDWNESTHPIAAAQRRVLQFLREPGALTWYPDVEALELSKAVAAMLGVSPLQVLAFGGSDVALEALARTYLDRSHVVALAHPGYDNFRVYAAGAGARCSQLTTRADGRGFDLDYFLEQLAALHEGPRLIYLINPNNPIGYLVPCAAIGAIASQYPASILVVDEAYIEFAPAGSSAVPLVERHPNLVVSRSFSKAYGLAGLRCGYLVSSTDILRAVRKIRNGKNLTMIAQVAALAALESPEGLEEHVKRVLDARERFVQGFRQRGGVAWDSSGNFVLLSVPKPHDVILELRRQKILVRDRSHLPGLEDCVRISIGYEADMERVLAAFDAMPPDIWRIESRHRRSSGSGDLPRGLG